MPQRASYPRLRKGQLESQHYDHPPLAVSAGHRRLSDLRHQPPGILVRCLGRAKELAAVDAGLCPLFVRALVDDRALVLARPALDVPFRWNDAVRLGFLGYLLTFVSLGAVGGDLLKAFFVAREQPGRRIEAFATVIVDRVIGLYALLLLASTAIVFSRTSGGPVTPIVAALYQTILACTAAASIGFVLLLVVAGPRGTTFVDWLGRLPTIGNVLRPLAGAMQMYRRRLGVVAVSVLLGIVVQSLLVFTIWATGTALLSDPPTLARHFMIVPVSMLTAMLPLPGYGLARWSLRWNSFIATSVAQARGKACSWCWVSGC